MEQKMPQLLQERTFGGDPGTGQDVTIILVPNGGGRDQKLAVIHLHSDVLRTHSKYFNTCLSTRWTKSASLPSLEFVLEVQADVGFYFDCFSSMYSPLNKHREFQGVNYGLELVKVASQIDFQGLIDHSLLYLSTIFWSDEDEIRIREYSSSPDFPRNHAGELVARLGLDESEEDCQKQLCDLIRQCIRTALLSKENRSTRAFFTELLQRNYGPSNFFPKTVAMIVTREAKDMFTNIENAWDENPPHTYDVSKGNSERLEAMTWVLETLLLAQVAEELVQGIAHFSAIPQFIKDVFSPNHVLQLRQKFAELVRRMYQEVVDGHLLLRMPERLALLANWHSVGARLASKDQFSQVTEKLFFTLPLKQQIEFINQRKENYYKCISTSSLISMLSKKCWPARELEEPTKEPIEESFD